MSGLAHYFEEEGIPTVVVALVREHVQKMKPPRALWVPYPLGRPFGAPNNATVQTRILRQALQLLEMPSGPVLVDAMDPVEIEVEVEVEVETQSTGWVCPVNFAKPTPTQSDLTARVSEEILQLRPWYELGVERRGRTTVGLASTPVVESALTLAGYVQNPEHGEAGSEADLLRWSAGDVVSYYLEAATAQPGGDEATQLESWFWHETAGGEMLKQLRKICLAHDDPGVQAVGAFMLVNERYVSEN